MNNKGKDYTGIDIFKFVFACLIPLLHIEFDGILIDIVRQYLSRIGVPFFFASTGFFLYGKIKNQPDRKKILLSYVKKISIMLVFWFVIYFPLFRLTNTDLSIKTIVLQTPGYLWYLTAVLIAVIPFVLFRNRKLLYIISILLYLLGVILGESYSWLWEGTNYFESVFVTSRNGIMFGMPMMCVGELVYENRLNNKQMDRKKTIILLVVSYIVLATEITIVGFNVEPQADRSMYFALPVFVYFLFDVICYWNPKIDTRRIRLASAAIYLMQYGIIKVFSRVLKGHVPTNNLTGVIVLALVVLIPTMICHYFYENKIVNKIF